MFLLANNGTDLSRREKDFLLFGQEPGQQPQKQAVQQCLWREREPKARLRIVKFRLVLPLALVPTRDCMARRPGRTSALLSPDRNRQHNGIKGLFQCVIAIAGMLTMTTEIADAA